MEFPYVAASVGAVLIILQQVLMMMAGAHRGKAMVGVGVGSDLNLERKVRRHGNLAENAAIFLVVLGFAEILSEGGAIVTTLGVIFLIARISHAIAFSSLTGSHLKKGPVIFTVFRMGGALGTGVSGIGLGFYLLYLLLA